MKKYKFYSALFTGAGAPESHIQDLERIEEYCSENPGLCYREAHNGVSTFQIETDNKDLAFMLRLGLRDTYYYTKNE